MSSGFSTPASGRIAVSTWSEFDDLAAGYTRQLTASNYHPVRWHPHHTLPDEISGVLAYGPIGSLAPLTKQLCMMGKSRRPAFALLLTEQLPNPRLADIFQRNFGIARAWVERLAYHDTASGVWQPRRLMKPLISRAHRYRYYGELLYLRQQDCLDVLATWSYWWSDYLNKKGFQTIVPQRGFSRELGDDLNLPRDIPVLWLGKVGSDRRGELLAILRRDLEARGIPLHVVDGVENPFVFGEARNQLINRSRIMVNLLREPWDDNSLRISLAAHNKALLISEPMLPHSQFQPGEHFLVSPFDEISATITYYLAHESERQAIVENAYQFLKRNLNSTPGAVLLVEQALSIRSRATEYQ